MHAVMLEVLNLFTFYVLLVAAGLLATQEVGEQRGTAADVVLENDITGPTQR
jgi:hypothetical protein